MKANTILVIEDNPLNLELVTDLLEAGGFIVWQARTAMDGLCVARAMFPDLVLMDLGLPDMHGLSATQILKSDPATCNLPVIALTAHAMKGDEISALEAGCDGFLTKPIDTRTFAATVRFLLSRNTSPFTPIQTS
jgi:CheY-like chemotaxis protein